MNNYSGEIISLTVRVKKIKNEDKEAGKDENKSTSEDTSPVYLGHFEVHSKNELKPKVDKSLFGVIEEHSLKNYTNKIWKDYKEPDTHSCLDKRSKYYSKDRESIIEVYKKNGMLKVYYDSIFGTVKNIKKERISGKVSAMCSYIAIRDYLNKYFGDKELDYEVSNPNVFVENNNVEFDALIINKNGCKGCIKDKYFFIEDSVVAVIEIKTAGYFSSQETEINKEFKKYIEKGKLKDKKYIYFSVTETFGVKDDSKHTYEYLWSTIQNIKNNDKNDVYGIFCSLQYGSQKNLIPYEYDLNKCLDEIFKPKMSE